MPKVSLSILIPTMASRASLLSRLLWTLEPQLCPEVEVIVHASEQLTMGEKFNALFEMANGKFGVLVDDDDIVVSDYVSTVLGCVDKDADYIGYNTLYTVSGRYQDVYVSDPRTAIHQPYSVDLTLRHIHHKCPVLVEKARQHRFGEDYGADYYWVEEMIKDGYPFKPILIDRALYHYDYWPQYSMGKGSAQRNVGIWPFDASKFTWVE